MVPIMAKSHRRKTRSSRPRTHPARRYPRSRSSERDAQESFVSNIRKFIVFLIIAGFMLYMAMKVLDRAWVRKIEHQNRPAEAVVTATNAAESAAAEDEAPSAETAGETPVPDTTNLLARAQQYIERGIPDAAADMYQQILKTDPAQTDALRGLADLHIREGKYREARSALEEYVKTKADDVYALNDLGVIHLLMNQPEEAATVFHTAYELNDEITTSLFNLILALQRMNRHAEAMEAIDAFLEKNENDPNGWKLKAQLLAEDGMYEDALFAIRRALDIDGDWMEAHMVAATLYALSRQPAKALDHLRRMAEIASPSAAYRFYTRRVFNDIRETEAGKAFEKEVIKQVKASFGQKEMVRKFAASERPRWSEVRMISREELRETLKAEPPPEAPAPEHPSTHSDSKAP